ncbi:MAG: PEP-CTERM sorting domain-containing protein [Phycisphaerae bacterium]|nr:PEP-CTERM sorting domain-containing protein [Phycisphaerae bacterium]
MRYVVFAAAIAATAGTASAQLTLYTSQAAFNAATTGPVVDTFDDLSPIFYSGPLVRTVGSYSYQVNAASGLYGAGSGSDGWMSTNSAPDGIVFNNFSPGVFAIGGFFFTSNIAGLFDPGNITVTATDANGNLSHTVINSTTTSFVGFTSVTGIISLTVSAVQPSSGAIWPTVNDLTLALPTPGAAALLGLGGLMAVRRRR